MMLKFGFLGGIGIILALLALYWIQPETTAGQSLLAVIVFSLVNGVGAVLWPSKTTTTTTK
jgi:hypothetical protein